MMMIDVTESDQSWSSRIDYKRKQFFMFFLFTFLSVKVGNQFKKTAKEEMKYTDRREEHVTFICEHWVALINHTFPIKLNKYYIHTSMAEWLFKSEVKLCSFGLSKYPWWPFIWAELWADCEL